MKDDEDRTWIDSLRYEFTPLQTRIALAALCFIIVGVAAQAPVPQGAPAEYHQETITQNGEAYIHTWIPKDTIEQRQAHEERADQAMNLGFVVFGVALLPEASTGLGRLREAVA